MLRNPNEKSYFFDLLPFILMVTVMPFYMKAVRVVSTPLEAASYAKLEHTDIFSYARGNFAVILVIAALLLLLASILTGEIKVIKDRRMLIPATLGILVVLSYTFAIDPLIALRGTFDRHEGILVTLSYFVSFMIAWYYGTHEKKLRIIGWSLIIASLFYSGVALFQAFGLNFINSDLFRSFVIGPDKLDLVKDIVKNNSKVYSFFANPNYLGNYGIMVFPLAYYFYLEKKNWSRYTAFAATVLSLAATFCAGSLAGILGAAVGATLQHLLYRRNNQFSLPKLLTPITCAIMLFLVVSLVRNTIAESQEIFVFIAMYIVGVIGAEIAYRKPSLISKRSLTFIALACLIFTSSGIFLQAQKLRTEAMNVFYLEDFRIDKNTLHIAFYDSGTLHSLKLENIGRSIRITGDNLDHVVPRDVTNYEFSNTIYDKFSFKKNLSKQFDFLYFNKIDLGLFVTDSEFAFVDINRESNTIQDPPKIPVDGFELLGNSRAYIWSRSIPLLLKYPLVGAGPDNFVFVFPQRDVVGKINIGKTHLIVDKPHNWYLQTGVNQGVISMLLLLLLFVLFIRSCWLRIQDGMILAVPMLTSVAGYHVIQIFNDSVVGTASIFWVMYGLYFGFLLQTKR